MARTSRRLARLVGVGVTALAAALGSISVANADVEPNIVGGTDAEIADFPFTVALTDSTGFQFCGGSIIAPNKVLTAAHCTTGQNAADVQVVSGRTALSGSDGAVTPVGDIWIHPDYTDATAGSDVSVLTLSKDIPNAQPIELATADDPSYAEGTDATALGWGATSEGGETSDTLKQVTVPVTSDQTCSSAYPEYKSDAMVCAGVEEGGKDSCQGDSGGPLIAGDKLIGVVSWGQGCAQPGFPGVYSRVGSYADLISQQ